MGAEDLGRPIDKHLDNPELDALVPSFSESGEELHGLSPDAIHEARRHADSCEECRRRVSRYRQLVHGLASFAISGAAPRKADCPLDEAADWREVAAGLWPDKKTKYLIMHAALCEHCGPRLRSAISHKPAVDEVYPNVAHRVPRQFLRWLTPVLALLAIFAALITTVSGPVSGAKFAELSVKTHRQYAQGDLSLDIRSDSQLAISEWFKTKSDLPLDLPASPAATGEDRPYRLEGARLIQVRGKNTAFVAYQLQSGPASLLVTPDSAAVASGGIEVSFKKVSFHYAMVNGYKVVTWSQHGLTYALVSQEGNSTQQSCMVCHSAMKDRDLTHIPAPLHDVNGVVDTTLQ
jgi:anti-sigma factor RsiW